ncbi:MAG: AAA family ATPase, partial [Stackebrandtia sp.]
MRPLRLDLDGFASFARAASVDFAEADYFALVGPTGAGKSTVLDAMCFALYGRAPRWGAGIEHALAPSATSGSVRLTFRADGKIYVATRVLKRGTGGKVLTNASALERLPADTSTADLADVGGLIGVSLAASAKAVTAQVERIVGLPFEQFTKCVLLPQGAFAEFLHSSGAERRKILESLLGYTVYREIQTAAGEEHRAAEAAVALLDRQLGQLPTVTAETIAEADARIARLRDLADFAAKKRPELDELAHAAATADQALRDVDAEHALLTYIKRPSDVDSLAEEHADAERAVAAARKTVADAEAAEEGLRGEVARFDVAGVDRLLQSYAKAAETAENIVKGAELTRRAEAEAERAEVAGAQAADALEAARRGLDEAKTADLASALREHLHAGEPCPVCRQTVDSPPRHEPHD